MRVLVCPIYTSLIDCCIPSPCSPDSRLNEWIDSVPDYCEFPQAGGGSYLIPPYLKYDGTLSTRTSPFWSSPFTCIHCIFMSDSSFIGHLSRLETSLPFSHSHHSPSALMPLDHAVICLMSPESRARASCRSQWRRRTPVRSYSSWYFGMQGVVVSRLMRGCNSGISTHVLDI